MKHWFYFFLALTFSSLPLFGQELVNNTIIESHGLTIQVDGVSTTMLPQVKEAVELQVSLSSDNTVSGPLADDLAFFVTINYLKLGYPEAEVDWDLVDGKVILTVKEGPLYTIGNIEYKGNKSQPEGELTAYLLRTTRERVGALNKNMLPFVMSDLREGSSYVQRYFQAQGFLNAVVKEPAAFPRPETKTQDIVVDIVEGTRYTFGAIQVTGDLRGLDREVSEQFADITGQPFNEVKAESIRAQIASIFEQRGYFSATVTADADMKQNAASVVPVSYHVLPGGLYRVTKLEIAPEFSNGAERLTRSSFNVALGRQYIPKDLELMHRRTLDSEVFSRLNVTPEPHADGTMTLKITGEEAMTRRVAVYGGYETFQGPILGFELRKVNLWDTGDAVQFKGEISGAGWSGGIKWIDPAIFNSPNSFDVELKSANTTFFDILRKSTGIRSTLRRQWNTHFTTSLFGEYSINNVSSDVYLPTVLGPSEYTIAMGGFSAILDYRNNPLIPVKGWMASITLAGGTETTTGFNFVQTEALFAFYQPITKKLRASFAARTRSISGGDTMEDIPFSLRVFNGGSTSVRSFPEQEMGLSPETVGGQLAQTFNVELSYEIVSNLEIAAFFDAGNLIRDSSNPFASPTDLRYAVGMGVRYKLPFGPLRIDYGYNPAPEEGDPMGALHITFGFAF